MYQILDKLEEKYESFTFGKNKDDEIFVNGQNTGIKIADFDTLEALIAAAKERGVNPHVGIIRAHDSFYAESILAGGDYLVKDKPWIDSGVLSTENESSTLFTLATVRKCRSGTILIPVGHHLFPDEMISTEQLSDAIKLETLIALDATVKLKQKFG